MCNGFLRTANADPHLVLITHDQDQTGIAENGLRGVVILSPLSHLRSHTHQSASNRLSYRQALPSIVMRIPGSELCALATCVHTAHKTRKHSMITPIHLQ